MDHMAAEEEVTMVLYLLSSAQTKDGVEVYLLIGAEGAGRGMMKYFLQKPMGGAYIKFCTRPTIC